MNEDVGHYGDLAICRNLSCENPVEFLLTVTNHHGKQVWRMCEKHMEGQKTNPLVEFHRSKRIDVTEEEWA